MRQHNLIARFIYRRKDGTLIGHAIDYMGFVFLRRKTILRKKIMIRATRFAGKLSRTKKIARRQALSMMSRLGWFKHTDTSIIWATYIEPRVNVNQLKAIIRRRTAGHEDTMDKRAGLWAAAGTL